MPQIVEMTCPGCGARVQIDQKTCEWCHAPIVITSMSDIFSMFQVNSKIKSFEKVIRP